MTEPVEVTGVEGVEADEMVEVRVVVEEIEGNFNQEDYLMRFIVACGTSDGEKLTDDHFGESEYFDIYDLDDYEPRFVKKVENDTREEDEDLGHGDPGKAKEVSQILKDESVNVVLAHQMGPNIVRISKRFVPVIYRGREVDRAIGLLLDNIHLVEREWRKGEKREYVVLENDQG